jgi:uncharacterized coiled-coil protein SlyX
MPLRKVASILFLYMLASVSQAQQSADERLRDLERKLEQATQRIDRLKDTVQTLRAEIDRIKAEKSAQQATVSTTQPSVDDAATDFVNRILEPELGANARADKIQAKPEILVQVRYSALPIREAGSEFEPDFSVTRLETHWAGRVEERLGAGIEIQFHPAIDGSPEELVNNAFLEYYLNANEKGMIT